MLSYQQIKNKERELYVALNELNSILNQKSFKQIFDTAGLYEYEKHQPDSFLGLEHAKLMSRLYTYIINQIPRPDAQKMILDEFKYKEPIIIQRLIESVYIQQKNRMRPQYIFAAHMMKKAGLTNKKIATTLKVTAATITQYLKIKTTV